MSKGWQALVVTEDVVKHHWDTVQKEAFSIGYKPGDELDFAVGRLLPHGVWTACIRGDWLPPNTFLILLALSALGFTALRLFLSRYILPGVTATLNVKPVNWVKFNESVMQMGFYFFAFVYNTKYLVHQDFFHFPIVSFLDGFACQETSYEIFMFYAIEIGWYLHCVYAQFFLDSKKSDFWVMLAHHVITLSLQFFAFTFGYFRIGMLVMFSMDVCDVFLHGAKIMRFITAGGKIEFSTGAYIFGFSLIPLSWAGLRLVYFPVFVLYTTAVLTPYYGGLENCIGYYGFNTLLFLLYLLQIWWFGVICLVGMKGMREGIRKLDDTRDPSRVAEKKGQ